MPLFWITFNLLYLQNLIVLSLTGIVIGYSENITMAFCYVIAIINLVIIATFFHKTYRDIINYLLKTELSKDGFFGLISIYFEIVETNS